MYIGNLVEDRKNIYEGLVKAGFEIQAEEFTKFADKAEIYIADKTHSSITFVVVPQAVAQRICDDEPVDYHELLFCAEAADREFAVMLIRNAKREFADFSGLTVSDAAMKILHSNRREDSMPADAV